MDPNRRWCDHRPEREAPGEKCLDCNMVSHLIVGSPGFPDGIGWPGPCDWQTRTTKAEGKPVNDATCPFCRETRCAKAEKKCWRCGEPL
jgi:hypothetical protein